MGVGADEVVIPAVSFYATAGAGVRRGGARRGGCAGGPSPDGSGRRGRGGRSADEGGRACSSLRQLASLPTVAVPVVEDGAQAVGRTPVGGLMALSHPTKVLKRETAGRSSRRIPTWQPG